MPDLDIRLVSQAIIKAVSTCFIVSASNSRSFGITALVKMSAVVGMAPREIVGMRLRIRELLSRHLMDEAHQIREERLKNIERL